MADLKRDNFPERDACQAITTLKKGAYLLKFGRRGRPKFCPFRLSNDEKLLIWYSGRLEKQLKLSHVSKIIPGQRTAVFQRYPQPEKEYQSFSLIYSNRSMDLICKDKDEAEVWLAALRALIPWDYSQWKSEATSNSVTSDSIHSLAPRKSQSNLSCSSSDIIYKDPEDSQTLLVPYENSPQNRLGKAFSEVFSYTAAAKAYTQAESFAKRIRSLSSDGLDDHQSTTSATDTFRTSISSALSSSSKGSYYEDIDNFSDVFIWGEGIGDGLLGGGIHRLGSTASRMDAYLPKALESTIVLDPHNIACGSQHAVLVTKQRQLFSWGEGSGGRLGHGVETDVSHPKLIDDLSGLKFELVACGEFQTCAVSVSGDLYTWGDGSETSNWTPNKLRGQDSSPVSFISCGPWHTAFVTSAGELFTFGDGTFGALGHGDRNSTAVPREVETLKGLRTVRASCGVWHTAAIVEVTTGTSSSESLCTGKLFTWGDGDKGQLGHGDKEHRLVPSCVAASDKTSFSQVTCGNIITIALTTSGQVYTTGSASFGQPCINESVSKVPTRVEGNIRNRCIEEIACGSHHVAVLSSKGEVYTWGKGKNGQLGHGDNEDRKNPTLVKALKDREVKKVVCGSNFTAVICLHKWMSGADHSICSGCRNSFSFRRKRHNCYNCGLVFCKSCSSSKSLKAALAPSNTKPHRVCDDCYTKLKRSFEYRSTSSGSIHRSFSTVAEKGDLKHGSFNRRPASFDSFKLVHSQHSNKGKLDCWNSHVRPMLDESLHRKSPSQFENSKIFSTSVSMVSRATSRCSRRSSPAYLESIAAALTNLDHPEVMVDVSNEKEVSLSQEINILKAQVEELTSKSQNLEAELENSSRKLRETKVTAGEEAEKTKAAKEVIRSLAARLKLMVKKVPQS